MSTLCRLYFKRLLVGYFSILYFTGGSVADDEGSESSGGGDNADESMQLWAPVFA